MAENGFADGVVAGMATNNDRTHYGGGFGYGGDWIWIILLFALFGNGGFGFGGGFNNGLSYDFPWLLQGQNGINDNVSNNFRDNAISSKLDSIQNTLSNNAANAMQTSYENQIASMQQNFAMQQAFANCCCENRLGTADLKATVLAENCADRALLSDGIRDVIVNQNAGIQKILDQLCQDKIDAKNETIAQLRQELLYSRGQASQVEQTARILAGQAAEIDGVYNRLKNCPVGTYNVSNPYIYPNSNGCGCVNGNI